MESFLKNLSKKLGGSTQTSVHDNDGVCILTGAASGIGKCLAFELAKRTSLKLMLLDMADVQGVATECCTIRSGYTLQAVERDDVRFKSINVTDEKAMQEIADEAVEWGGHIKVVIPCAAVPGMCVDNNRLPGLMRQAMEVNCCGVINTVAPCIEHMRKSDTPGCIAFPSTLMIKQAKGGGGLAAISVLAKECIPYLISKQAMTTWADMLGTMLLDTDITVIKFIIGLVDTPIHGGGINGGQTEASQAIEDAKNNKEG